MSTGIYDQIINICSVWLGLRLEIITFAIGVSKSLPQVFIRWHRHSKSSAWSEIGCFRRPTSSCSQHLKNKGNFVPRTMSSISRLPGLIYWSQFLSNPSHLKVFWGVTRQFLAVLNVLLGTKLARKTSRAVPDRLKSKYCNCTCAGWSLEWFATFRALRWTWCSRASSSWPNT